MTYETILSEQMVDIEDLDLEDYVIKFLNGYVGFIEGIWLIMTIMALIVAVAPPLRSIGVHGKRLTQGQTFQRSIVDEDFEGFIARLVVPKAYFTHFYYVGSITTAIIILWTIFRPYPVNQLSSLLFLAHCLRRLYECHRLTLFEDAQMHMTAYFVGLLHYTLAPLTILVAICEQRIVAPHSALGGLGSGNLIRHGIISLLFVLFNILQYNTHYALFLMKTRSVKDGSSGDGSGHSFPRAWMFSYCACPHYAAEIGLYVCLLLLHSRCKSMYFLALWVAANLSVVAYQQYCWYLEVFPDEVLSRRWYILIPFVW
eukprot:gene26627-32177_t